MITNFADIRNEQKRHLHSTLLDALYYYEKLVTFCGTDVNSGLNRLYQMQSAGIPGNIGQAIDNRMFSNDPNLGNNLPGVHILRAVNYAENLITLNLCSWIKLLEVCLNVNGDNTNIPLDKTASNSIQFTPFSEFLYNMYGGIQLYGRFNPDLNICHKLEELSTAIFDIKKKQNIPFEWHYDNARRLLESTVATVNHQFSYISTVSGVVPDPEETNPNAVESFLKCIPLALSIFRDNRDILLNLFRILYVFVRLRSGCVVEPKRHTLIHVTKKISDMRISDTTVACIPFPIAQILPYFEEVESSRIGRYALYYVDRLSAFIAGKIVSK